MKDRLFLLDTNILIEIIHGNMAVIKKVEAVGPRKCFMSIISLHEMYFGAYNAPKGKYRDQELKRIEWLQKRFVVINLSDKGAESYGEAKAYLRRIGRPVDEFDLLIGEQAIVNGLVLVTHNVRHFKDMPGLEVEDWEMDSRS